MITTDKISFVLDGKITSIDFTNSEYSPTTTVLNYLRSLPNHKGVKEGCGEGDCGACTVVIADVSKTNKLVYKSFNSCLIFLPFLHGKLVITIENLGNSSNLHPLQKLMIEKYGSQCGFCTPGILMSLFSLYKNETTFSKDLIIDYLSGNLCRCTGYKPIIEVAESIQNIDKTDYFSEQESELIKLLAEIKSDTKPILLEKSQQKYFLPLSINDALNYKYQNHKTEIINGSTDIALRVTKRKEIIKDILDLSHIESFKTITVANNGIIIGSGCSIELVRKAAKNTFPALYSVLSVFGSKQIRNRATIGGNIASASPIGDTLPVLIALDAEVQLISHNGKRQVKLAEFIKGYRKTDISKYEIISDITLIKPKPNSIIKSYKISKRKELDISTVSVCFRLLKDTNNIATELKIVYGGMAEQVKQAVETEKFLTGKEWTRTNIEQATEILKKEFTPISDARATAEGRTIVASNLLLKFWSESQSDTPKKSEQKQFVLVDV